MIVPKKKPIDIQLNLTPMIDLIMNLLIFFMLVSQMSVVERTPVDLPGVSQGRAPVVRPEDKVAITMKTAAGKDTPSYRVGTIAVTDLAEVGRRLKQVKAKSPDVELVLRAEKNIPYRQVREVMKLAGQQGIRTVELAISLSGS